MVLHRSVVGSSLFVAVISAATSFCDIIEAEFFLSGWTTAFLYFAGASSLFSLIVPILSIFGLFFNSHVFANNGWSLKIPSPHNSLSVLPNGVKTILPRKRELMFLDVQKPDLLQIPFNPQSKNYSERFGVTRERKRSSLLKGSSKLESPQFLYDLGENLMVFDQKNLSFSLLDSQLRHVSARSLVLDQIKPASDSRGEPTRAETVALRRKIRELFEKGEFRVEGLAHFPKRLQRGRSKKESSRFRILLVSGIKDFNLMIGSCSKDDPTNCRIDRSCYLAHKFPIRYPRGVAVHPKKRLLLIGDQTLHHIRVYEYRSCYHVKHLYNLQFSKRLKSISDFSVDRDKRLWLTTYSKDDYYNASAFIWDYSEWWQIK